MSMEIVTERLEGGRINKAGHTCNLAVRFPDGRELPCQSCTFNFHVDLRERERGCCSVSTEREENISKEIQG